jgi:hypothetical protein
LDPSSLLLSVKLFLTAFHCLEVKQLMYT